MTGRLLHLEASVTSPHETPFDSIESAYDLRTLRRLLLEERKQAAEKEPPAGS